MCVCVGGGGGGLGGFLQFFNKNTHFYAYFGQTSSFKAITHQLKAFEKMKYKFCSIRINVTNYHVTFEPPNPLSWLRHWVQQLCFSSINTS